MQVLFEKNYKVLKIRISYCILSKDKKTGGITMTCREACKEAGLFIQNRLPVWNMEEFLDHIRECKDCREELELDYSLNLVLYANEDESTNFNVEDALDDILLAAQQKVFYWKIWEKIKYILTTIVFWCVLLVGCLQVYQWMMEGF